LLSELRLGELKNLRKALEFEDMDPEERLDMRKMGAVAPDVHDVKDAIRTDPDRLWEQYLDRALKISLRS
jgi:hypothetical protein